MRIAPETVGLPRGQRRRVQGLRREEVADLAGVGITWYTWLEQARNIQASDDVLAALARTLRLDADETAHLFSLARPPAVTPLAEPLVPSRYQLVLDALDPNPAHIRDRRWNLLAWNEAFASSTGFHRVAASERNLLRLLFVHPTARRLLANWPEVAETAVAQFRYESGPFTSDPGVIDLVESLRDASSDFDELWSLHDVYSGIGTRTEWRHPSAGSLEFERCVLAHDGSDRGPSQGLLHVLVPVPGSGTEAKVAALRAA